MDDWKRAAAELPGAAHTALDDLGDRVNEMFLDQIAAPYAPVRLPSDRVDEIRGDIAGVCEGV